MSPLLASLALVAIAALPSLVLADDSDPANMTCADLSGKDKDGIMKAVGAMHMAGPDALMKMDAVATAEAMGVTVDHCKDKPDMMAIEAMPMT
ncbi:MAG TPA: hypothetical protein VI412_11445 [Tabrizicola sp.]